MKRGPILPLFLSTLTFATTAQDAAKKVDELLFAMISLIAASRVWI